MKKHKKIMDPESKLSDHIIIIHPNFDDRQIQYKIKGG